VTLRAKIEQEIRERGPIPFSRYMEMCLYHPELGYYARNAEQFGKAGDFYTSSDVHAVFGRLLTRQFEEMWRALGSLERIEILELGPGRGLFAQDVLDWSEKKSPEFFRALHYVLVEGSQALRARITKTLAHQIERQKASLRSAIETGSESAEELGLVGESAAERRESPSHSSELNAELRAARAAGQPKGELHHDEPNAEMASAATAAERRENVAHGVSRGSGRNMTQAPEGRKNRLDTPAIVFANEFFDALPVEVLSQQGALRIDLRDGHFTETWVPPSAEELEFLDRYSVHPEPGERVEVPLLGQHYISKLATALDRGFVIGIDYGYTRDEQLARRHRGTVMAYRQHSASANPYEAPGEQDITAHVNFTALAAAAAQNGMQVQPLLTQSQFLMGIGEKTQFADAFEDCRLPQERAKVALQLKHLVTPAGMGESFHVLVASKGVEPEKNTALSGLSFARSRL